MLVGVVSLVQDDASDDLALESLGVLLGRSQVQRQPFRLFEDTNTLIVVVQSDVTSGPVGLLELDVTL